MTAQSRHFFIYFFILAEVADLSESLLSLFNDGSASRLYDLHQYAKLPIRDPEIVVLKQAPSPSGDPNLRGVGRRTHAGDMHVYRLQRIALIDPKVHHIAADPK